MRSYRYILGLVLLLLVFPVQAQLISLAYHDVVEDRHKDSYALTRAELVDHLEFLRKNNYQPISLAYLKRVQEGRARLPDRAVLLTFDDGLRSYKNIVVPLLEKYGYPSVLSVVSGWLDGKRVPPEYDGKLMTWSEVKQLSRSPLVEVISHSHDLHHGVPSNPQGNESYASTTREYYPGTNRYESEKVFSSRIRADLYKAISRFTAEVGQRPFALTYRLGTWLSVPVDAGSG
jgi:biofilm PGA synthesis lipoprotein PgaB